MTEPTDQPDALTIATWNINSVRLRIGLVEKLLNAWAPDVLCLQEIKVDNQRFPAKAFEAFGYPHLAVNGQKGYNGVAIASRLPFEKVSTQQFCERTDARHICAKLAGGTEIHNFYVPAGGDEPDPETNDKFAHKLSFLEEMATWFKRRRDKKSARLILTGDLNVAPLEHDVWSHKKMKKIISHTPIEIEHLMGVMSALGWRDVIREHIPEPEKVYSWWSYRAKDWQTADKGRRLDHIWVSPALPKAQSVEIVKEARGWERPSDHVPIVTTLSLNN